MQDPRVPQPSTDLPFYCKAFFGKGVGLIGFGMIGFIGLRAERVYRV